MTESIRETGDLDDVVIRICLACGVVNPSGPSDRCPHLQLARFDGVDDELAQLLAEAAEARRRFDEVAGVLKRRVRSAITDGKAEVEASSSALPRDMEPSKDRSSNLVLNLEPTRPKRAKPRETKKRPSGRRRRVHVPQIDPRQLELIAREPPKGDA